MSDNITVLFVMELIGTAAFSCSGAMAAIRKNLDLLGIIVLGVVTAVGGGMIRDVLIGIHPPTLLIKPVYVTVAVIAAIAMFLAMHSRHLSRFLLEAEYYDWTMNLLDAIGLGAFTVIGVNTAYSIGYGTQKFLLLFVGVITGVGGGVLRDMMSKEMPFIFVKHIYACASLAGAMVCVALIRYNKSAGMILGALVVIIIRLLAAKNRWNLPKIERG